MSLWKINLDSDLKRRNHEISNISVCFGSGRTIG